MRLQLDRAAGERLVAISRLLDGLGEGFTSPVDEEVRFLRDLGERAIAAAPEDGPIVHMPRLLGQVFGVSTSEARRLLATGGVRIGGRRVSALDLPRERVDGQQLMLGLNRTAVIDLGKPDDDEPVIW